MTETHERAENTQRIILGLRVAVGLAQGLAFFVIAKWSDAAPRFGFDKETWPHVAAAIRTVAAFAPLPLLFGLGNLPARRLAPWTAIAAFVLFYVGWLSATPVWSGAPPVITTWLFSLIVLYIAHEFVQAAYDDKTPIASYPTYFDRAWRHAFQAALALGFAGALWTVLWLGAYLFALIGVQAFIDVLRIDLFAWTITTVGVALGVQLTDASSGLTRGARQIGLTLLSWLAIVLTLILTAFLATLPFVGLEPLWDTKRATVLLLNAAATMILLINAAFQAGDPPRSAVMRVIIRFSAFPLAGVVGLAALGLWLRINQYGFTPARVVAGAELVIVAVHAAGYVYAAAKRGAWMAAVKPVNIGGAVVVAALLLALMTPVLDPSRVAVADQVARLEGGKVAPDDFDFGFLANDRAGAWGKAALKRLAAKSGSPRNDRIALLAKNPGYREAWRTSERQTFNDRRAALKLIGPGTIPDSALLPPAGDFDPIGDCVSGMKSADDETRRTEEAARRAARLHTAKPKKSLDVNDVAPPQAIEGARCLARFIDLNNDGLDDLLILQVTGNLRYPNAVISVVTPSRAGIWTPLARNRDTAVIPEDDDWREDRPRLERLFAEAAAAPSSRRDFLVGGARFRWFPITTYAPDRLRAAIALRGGAVLPDALTIDMPLREPVLECAKDVSSDGAHAAPCFGRAFDADGDGASEFVLISFSALSPKFYVYKVGTGGVTALGVALGDAAGGSIDSSWRYAHWTEDHRAEFENSGYARARLEIADTVVTVPALLPDLAFAGQTVMFNYAYPTPDARTRKLEHFPIK